MRTDRSLLRDGLTVGFIGYAGVALFYALFDFVAARGMLFTVNILGTSLLHGAPDQSVLLFPVEPSIGAILWYNAAHLLASLAIGLIVVWLLSLAAAQPSRVRVVQLVIVGGYVCTILAVGLLSRTIRPVLPWWSIVVVNSLAVLVAGSYLLLRRRPLVVPVMR
jgi:hypothetical protein